MSRRPKRIACAFIRRAVLVALLLAGTACVRTEPFRDAEGQVLVGSIASMETVEIGGIPQSIWFRGVSRGNPALILLHGGPGISESALFRHYNAALEQHFLVVYWEQRGSGRSYRSDIPPESMTIDRFVDDLDQVVELVRKRFDKEKVLLLGHSWGTVIGTIYASRHPEKVAVYVGVAQMVNTSEARRLSYAFALAEAEKRNDTDAVSELQSIGPPPYSSIDEMLTVGTWVERFGGMFHGELSTGRLIWAALTTDEAGLMDIVKFGQGNRFSLEQLEDEIAELDLSAHYRAFEVPIFFLLGRHDRHVPSGLAERYFEKIRAPCKQLVWFEQSAHNPPFEEPEKFDGVLIEQVLALADGQAGHACRGTAEFSAGLRHQVTFPGHSSVIIRSGGYP